MTSRHKAWRPAYLLGAFSFLQKQPATSEPTVFSFDQTLLPPDYSVGHYPSKAISHPDKKSVDNEHWYTANE